jgi:hypothetical protein
VTDAQVAEACQHIAGLVEAAESEAAASLAAYVERVAIPPEVRAERVRERRAAALTVNRRSRDCQVSGCKLLARPRARTCPRHAPPLVGF